MDALQASKLRLAIVLFMVTAFVLNGVAVPIPGDATFASQAWAGGGDDDDDDGDDDKDKHKKGRKKDFDHFACYTAGSHEVNKDVKIVNQFTKDDDGKIVAIPISVGELTLLCVPTRKILLDEDKKDVTKLRR
jgi:hypothetical protein